MKIRNLLLLGAAAFAAITINASASDAYLSPRAAGNQIQHVSGTANDVNLECQHGHSFAARCGQSDQDRRQHKQRRESRCGLRRQHEWQPEGDPSVC
jgi:hypothetical protein